MLILTIVYLFSHTVCVYLLWHFATGGTKLSQNESIKIHLEHLLKKSGLSKNKFCQKAEIQRSQLNGYINNTITRLDTEVLVRIC